MLRAVAVREGCIGDDDNLPDRFKYEALHFDNGIESKISENDLNIMLSEYYELRNWSPDGTISPEILSSLL
jgi:aldehyde:ferredoxin oxidoreductase